MMKKIFRISFFVLGGLVSVILLFAFIDSFTTYSDETELYNHWLERIQKVANEKGYNKQYGFIIDFSEPCSRKRMMLYDFEEEKIIKRYFVTHGSGCGSEGGKPAAFSNVPESHCSSEGLALINGRDYSGWGINIKYWLDGLDETNNNMKRRVVVLHSWELVPDENLVNSTLFVRLPQSWGCFAVSNSAMREIDEFIKNQQNKKILIYAAKR